MSLNLNDPCFPGLNDKRAILQSKIRDLKAKAFNAATEAVLTDCQDAGGADAEPHKAKVIRDLEHTAENCRRAVKRAEALLAELPEPDKVEG